VPWEKKKKVPPFLSGVGKRKDHHSTFSCSDLEILRKGGKNITGPFFLLEGGGERFAFHGQFALHLRKERSQLFPAFAGGKEEKKRDACSCDPALRPKGDVALKK